MNKKKNTHGALKNKEAFKGTLKQWGLISQAMLWGAENIDCFCDYTLTFSNVYENPLGVSLFSFLC